MDWRKEAEEIARRRAEAAAQGGPEAVAAQHAKGRLTIRERIERLAEPGSFREFGRIAGAEEDADGVRRFTPANYVVGFARIGGRQVVVGGEDFTLKGGSPNAAGLRKSVFSEDIAHQARLPLVRFLEGGGGSVRGSSGKGPQGAPVNQPHRFLSIARLLGEVPVVSAAVGPVAGFPAARLVASHFALMTRTAQVMIAGPKVVERAVNRTLTKEELGGPDVHAKTGVVDAVADTEEEACAAIARFLSYLPDNVWAPLPVLPAEDPPDRQEEALLAAVPRDRRRAYDMRRILAHVLDRDSLFEMTRKFGPGQITALARLAGHPVGVLANDCRFYAGAMTAEGAQKVRRFVDLCNTFRLPIISFVDEPGFMIGPEAEKAGTIRHGAAAIAAVVQSRVPWATVLVRKSFGVAAMAHFGPDGYVLSWPSSEAGPLPLEGGVAVAFAREIAAAPDPEAKRAELEALFAERMSPFPAAEGFSVHDLIDPRETRPALAAWLETARARLALLTGPHLCAMRP
ncbi:MAG: propionyl-CoA carboxylase [Alphaproteobacteria bacterium]|nr:propionyl-CoA carboxylase [Alphaproteobacteria bacterium]